MTFSAGTMRDRGRIAVRDGAAHFISSSALLFTIVETTPSSRLFSKIVTASSTSTTIVEDTKQKGD